MALAIQEAGKLPGLIVFGNCQAAPLAAAMRRVPGIGSRFVLHAVSSFDMEQQRPERFLEPIDMQGVVLLLTQRQTDEGPPAWLTEALPRGAAVLQFAAMDTELLWPLLKRDPRNQPEPGHPFGRYPYGDRLVVELLDAGLSGAALFEAYWEQSAKILRRDLEGLIGRDAARLVARDAVVDVGIGDIVLDQLRERPLFHTSNHPSGWLFRQMAGRVMDAVCRTLGLPSVAGEVAARLSEFDPLGREQVPIHPVIARQVRLAWWQPGQTYLRPDGTMVNFRQYMRGYIDFA